MSPAMQGAMAVIVGLWQGIKPLIFPIFIGGIIVLIICVIIIKIFHHRK